MTGRWPSLPELRRAVGWHRRLLAAGLAAAAVALGLTALSPAPPPSTLVVVARSDLAPGTRLRDRDLTTVALPPSAVPVGASRSAAGDGLVGRTLASGLRRGEPVTDVRLVGRALLRSLGGGAVAAPVRIADAGAVALLRPGDTIDVLAATPPSGSAQQAAAAEVVAAGARVLTVPAAADSAAGADGALVLLAVRPELALSLARAGVAASLSVTLRPG